MRAAAGGAGAVALALLLGALHWVPAHGQEYDYYGWQTEPLHGRSYSKPPKCLDIPADLPLCHTVGYKRMRLPNLLEHESLAEVKQQASSWLPLLAKRCHSDTQVFLCSLFAPVCLDQPIYPCRSLCEAVRAGCAPLMEAYGFPWPEMLHCHKFPLDNDLCIAVQFGHLPATAPPVTKICAQCEMEHSADGLMEQMCSSDFGECGAHAASPSPSFKTHTRVNTYAHTLPWELQQFLSYRPPREMHLFFNIISRASDHSP
ncbi:secreted frizzled related protein 5 [Phyllostomus discolor]|uniref:Secreted frizzled related protein 5 n=1 Tax=Phyllostomus discolor TaxID=89673 RepID=A0A834ABD3_9CHIR|nr:secreted frizzled related protein 5 [Phyllostomus discolor]